MKFEDILSSQRITTLISKAKWRVSMNETVSPDKLRENFWKEDKINGSVIKKQYDQIKSVLRDKNFEWVENQLLKIKTHAIKETEFYKEYEVYDDFPVMNKTLLIQYMDQCKAKGGFQLPLHTSYTSGSTGTPFSVVQDYLKRKRTIADLKVFGEMCDYPSHERMIFFRVINEKLHRTKEQEEKENIYYIDSSLMDEENLQKMLDAILKMHPRIIFSYASTLVELAKYVETKNISPSQFSMKSILTAGEALAEEERHRMQRVFGCKVFRRYSDMEMGILGQDLGDGGEYLLNYGSYYFECLKVDSDEPAMDGEVGRIVVTDLFNYAFPMIRYDTGDLGIMKRIDGEFPRLVEILGRDRDCVYTPEKMLLSPAKISTSMWGVEGLRQWQFIQNSEDTYTVRLNGSEKLNPQIVVNKLQKILGKNAKIRVQLEDDIPVLASNKRRAIINECING